ncbi:hypothetical protein JHK82_018721 [Glycine max]|nr:hypothetical protein JHK86_018745 [Glycine max]KAG5143026.1 hypothetical protein JHK82_018721 [Glycine max]
MWRDGYDGYGYAGGKSLLSAPMASKNGVLRRYNMATQRKALPARNPYDSNIRLQEVLLVDLLLSFLPDYVLLPLALIGEIEAMRLAHYITIGSESSTTLDPFGICNAGQIPFSNEYFSLATILPPAVAHTMGNLLTNISLGKVAIAKDVLPSDGVLKVLTLLSKVMPKAKLIQNQDIVDLFFREPSKRKLVVRTEVLGSLCDQRARMLQDQFSVNVNHVHALAILVSTFHYYRTPSTIDQSIQLGQHLNDHYSMGVAYAQRVVNSERGTFEKQHGWVIKTIEREPSLVRDEYAPMIFAQETISYLESLDMMFRDMQEDRENIFMARATRKVVLTSPFNLLGSHHLGVVLTFPVYKSKLPPKPTMEECIKATVGYVGGSFDVESLMENLVGQLTGHEAILVNVYDIKNSTNPLIMYGNQNKEDDMSLVHESKLDFGDPYGNHTIICR